VLGMLLLGGSGSILVLNLKLFLYLSGGIKV
jgi:hypothetical protein